MKKADILITLIVVAIGIGLLVYNTIILTDTGAIAKVYVDGQLYAELPLDQDGMITVETDRGNNIIAVEDGQVFIKDADCKDQLCVHMPAISVAGENIVCLPHHLHIEIEGDFDGRWTSMSYPTKKPSEVNKTQASDVKQLVLMALFVAVALVLSYIERLIPVNFALPGVKLGLANVVTCVALYMFKPKAALTIVVSRIMLLGLFAGSVTSFLYSMTGGVFSFFGMLVILKVLKKYVSPVGVSVVGAFCHNLGQVLVLGIITASLSVARTYFPILILTGVVTGVLVGYTAMFSMKYLRHFRLIHEG